MNGISRRYWQDYTTAPRENATRGGAGKTRAGVEQSGMATPTPPAGRATNPARARDHLANERTFLAWIRTGVSLVGFGILTAKLRYLQIDIGGAAPPFPAPAGGRSALLGAAFAVLSILVIVLGSARYAAAGRAIERDEFEPRGGQMLMLAFLLVLLGVAVLFYLADLWRA